MTTIVAIGCSLGGFRAVATILGGLAADFPCPIAVVQHRFSHGTEDYCRAMQRCCALPVTEAEDKQLIRAGTVYVAPAGYHLMIEDGAASLSVDAPVNFARPSIDVLFESVAESCGAGAIAVVLTGASTDGTRGATAVLAAGGRIVVQDPVEAECRVMPAAMLAANPGAAVLPIRAIAGWLVEHVARSA